MTEFAVGQANFLEFQELRVEFGVEPANYRTFRGSKIEFGWNQQIVGNFEGWWSNRGGISKFLRISRKLGIRGLTNLDERPQIRIIQESRNHPVFL